MPALGLAPVLGIVFIVLKLTGTIAWSWLWVLAPFWIPVLFGVIVLFFMFLAAAYAARKAEKQAEHVRETGFDTRTNLW